MNINEKIKYLQENQKNNTKIITKEIEISKKTYKKIKKIRKENNTSIEIISSVIILEFLETEKKKELQQLHPELEIMTILEYNNYINQIYINQEEITKDILVFDIYNNNYFKSISEQNHK